MGENSAGGLEGGSAEASGASQVAPGGDDRVKKLELKAIDMTYRTMILYFGELVFQVSDTYT